MSDLFSDLGADYRPDKLALVPEHLRLGLKRYIERGIQPGSALCAVLMNRGVFDVVAAMDDEALAGIRGLVQFLYNYAPATCHGSLERARDWIKRGGLKGPSAPADERDAADLADAEEARSP